MNLTMVLIQEIVWKLLKEQTLWYTYKN